MPRVARQKSESGIYHLILRGSNRQDIFHDDSDRMRFIETAYRYKRITGLKVYGWCLMDNHIHLLFGEGNEEISITMKRIGVSFMPKKQRDEILVKLKQIKGLSHRQIARIIGISPSLIFKANPKRNS